MSTDFREAVSYHVGTSTKVEQVAAGPGLQIGCETSWLTAELGAISWLQGQR